MSRLVTDARYAFIVDYFDPQANMVRKYQFLFFLNDNSIEMHDMKNKRVFLKRCTYPTLSAQDLFVGANITVHGRSLKVVECADELTRKTLEIKGDTGLFVITKEGQYNLGAILDSSIKRGMRVARLSKVFAPMDLSDILGVTGECVVVECTCEGFEPHFNQLKELFGTAVLMVAGDNVSTVTRFAFDSGESTAKFTNCSCLVIKPHAVSEGAAGQIIQRVLDDGFDVSALGIYSLTTADADDFLEVYKGVVPEYKQLVANLSSGPCWALEVQGEDAVPSLRALCGPHDTSVAKVLFPDSIRAQFGKDIICNAVHCSDLPEDGALESDFFFSLLLKRP
jgi:nucleoside-diphosphate kinase